MRHECTVCGWVLENCDEPDCKVPTKIVCLDCQIKQEEKEQKEKND